MRRRISRLTIDSFGGRGGLNMISGSPFSVPKASAGAPSVIKFSTSNWIAVSGDGKPARMEIKITVISARLHDNR